jgi:hypothetical protein
MSKCITIVAFDSKIVPDDKSNAHGTVQVKIGGVWGSVCSKGWSNVGQPLTPHIVRYS